MFMVTVRDEAIYRRLMDKVAQNGGSVDEVLRELLDREEDSFPEDEETSGMKLLRLIDETELNFDNPFDARDVDDILRNISESNKKPSHI